MKQKRERKEDQQKAEEEMFCLRRSGKTNMRGGEVR
jgi:hypothetical protein